MIRANPPGPAAIRKHSFSHVRLRAIAVDKPALPRLVPDHFMPWPYTGTKIKSIFAFPPGIGFPLKAELARKGLRRTAVVETSRSVVIMWVFVLL